jgi:hypothetical protein
MNAQRTESIAYAPAIAAMYRKPNTLDAGNDPGASLDVF